MKILILLLLTATVACTQNQKLREPAKNSQMSLMEKFYEVKVQEGFTRYQLQELQNKLNQKTKTLYKNRVTPEIENMKRDLSILESQYHDQRQNALSLLNLTQKAKNYTTPTSYQVWFDTPWRQHHDEVIVHDLQEFPLHQGKPVRQVSLSLSTAHTVYLQLSNYTLSWDLKKFDFKSNPSENEPYEFLVGALKCNSDARIHNWPTVTNAPANKETFFRWYDTKFNAARPVLQFSNPNTQCTLRFGPSDQSLNYGMRIVPEDQEMAQLLNPEKRGEICFLPQTQKQPRPIQYFLSPQLTQTTCPQKVQQYQTLENSLEGLNAKIRVLTGKNLSNEYIQKGDPFAPIDLSQAPQLDAILISYLVFRADFSGQVIMQALRYHAQRGTIIRIALSDVITLGKDRQMLFDLQAQFPNVKLLFYKYNSEGKGLKDWINTFHRTNHIKAFMTFSKKQEEANAVILGGRNIHDGFIFDQPVSNYITSNELITYNDKGDESWARWEDFETLFISKDLVQNLMAQFFTVMHSDYGKFYVRSYSEPVAVESALDPNYLNLAENEVYIRSLVSIPFKDDMLLERAFIQMFDSAEKRILLSTPYFNVTDNILKALERAADRGVQIELITRLDLKGDTADIVLGDVNKKSINKIYQKIKVYEYTTVGKILHSKLVIIDNHFVMMGSVNLNLRSFFHDVENATLVYGSGFNRKITALYESYKKESRLLTEKQKTTWWKSVLIRLLGTAL